MFLPLAISFFTFQQIMFLVGSARGEGADCDLLHYAAFVAFFPHLIAGPIVRPRDIIPQFSARTFCIPHADNIAAGLLLFLLGLAKKLVLGDMFGGFADIGFNAAAHGASLSFVEAWYATLAYALQIYFDFSGYSDMAIGLARMLNVEFPANFASPYQARNIAEFWRRWHITLGWFLRDYLYIPLGGSRCSPVRRTANLMLDHAAVRAVARRGLELRPVGRPARDATWCCSAPGRCACRASAAQSLTLFAVVAAWVPFRAEGMPAAWSMLRGMAGLNGIALPQLIVQAVPLAGHHRHPGAAAALSRRRPHPELSRSLRLSAAGLVHRAGAAARCRPVAACPPLGADRQLRLQRAGIVLRPPCHAVPLLPVLSAPLWRLAGILPGVAAAVCRAVRPVVLDRPLTLGFLRARTRRESGARRGADRTRNW